MKHILLLFPLIILTSVPAYCQTTTEPKELLDLRESFEKARSAALSPLEKKYIDALSSLKDRLTRKGDLNGALSIQAELAKLTVAAMDDTKLRLSKFATVQEFGSWIATTTWKTNVGTVFRFPGGSKMESTKSDGSVTKYALTIEKIGAVSWTYSNGSKEVMEVNPDLKSAKGSSLGIINRELSR